MLCSCISYSRSKAGASLISIYRRRQGLGSLSGEKRLGVHFAIAPKAAFSYIKSYLQASSKHKVPSKRDQTDPIHSSSRLLTFHGPPPSRVTPRPEASQTPLAPTDRMPRPAGADNMHIAPAPQLRTARARRETNFERDQSDLTPSHSHLFLFSLISDFVQ